jgi:thiol:disulfide interchange protein DsbG
MMHRVLPTVAALLAAMSFSLCQAAEYPAPIQAMTAKGLKINGEFDAPGGLEGYAASYRGRPLALYLTSDGEHVLVGTLFDDDGNNLSEAPLRANSPKPDLAAAWKKLSRSAWVGDGPKDADRVVYVFTDPNCPYCQKLWRQSQSHLDGHLQIRHVLVAALGPSSMGKAATILAADDPQKALDRHERHFRQGGVEAMKSVPPELRKRIEANGDLMRSLGINGTPGVVFRDRKGKVRVHTGLPPAKMLAELILR